MQIFVSDGTSVGRSAPLHPSGDGVREGCAPLALSRGYPVRGLSFRWGEELFCWDFEFSTGQEAVLVRILVSDGTRVGRSAPLHPLG